MQTTNLSYLRGRKKLFVYDTARGISRLIKAHFSDQYDLECCCRQKDMVAFNPKDFFAAILIINDYDDFTKISEINHRINYIITSSSIKKDFFEYPKIKNLTIFDLNIKKKEMIKLFKNKLISFEKIENKRNH